MMKEFSLIVIIVWGFLIMSSFADAQGQQPLQPLVTSGRSLQVLIEPTWVEGKESTIRVTFYEPNSTKIQRHVDFDVVIMDKDRNEIFSAANESYTQSALHSNRGVAIIPYTFPEVGSFTIKVIIYGINFIPSRTEFVEVPVSVTPEFTRDISTLLITELFQ
jgi:hypothetical protein